MSNIATQDLGQAKIQQLLAAVGTAPSRNDGGPETTVYDWRDPHYFNDDQCNRLAAIMSQVGALLSEQYAHFYNSEHDVTPSSIVQFYAADLPKHIDPQTVLTLSIGPTDGPACGYLAITIPTAVDWSKRLLGDAGSESGQEHQLSSLETSLLTDLTAAIGRAFLDPLRTYLDFAVGKELTNGCPDLGLDPTGEMCRITFQIKPNESNDISEVSFVFPCRTLAPLVGKNLNSEPKPSPEELAQILMRHVQEIPVTLRAQLATTRLSFSEVLNLAPDDILLLDKFIDEPVDVKVNTEVVFRGRPAQSGGRYAVFVTERATNTLQQTGNTPGIN